MSAPYRPASRPPRPGASTTPAASTLLATFPLGPKSEIRVSLDDLGGRRIVNLRTWFQTTEGTWLPTRRGVTLGIARLPELVAAIDRAIRLGGQR